MLAGINSAVTEQSGNDCSKPLFSSIAAHAVLQSFCVHELSPLQAL